MCLKYSQAPHCPHCGGILRHGQGVIRTNVIMCGRCADYTDETLADARTALFADTMLRDRELSHDVLAYTPRYATLLDAYAYLSVLIAEHDRP